MIYINLYTTYISRENVQYSLKDSTNLPIKCIYIIKNTCYHLNTFEHTFFLNPLLSFLPESFSS